MLSISEALNYLTKERLQNICRAQDLKVSGNKPEIIDRELLSKVDGAVKSRSLMRVGWVIIVHVYFTRPTDRRIV